MRKYIFKIQWFKIVVIGGGIGLLVVLNGLCKQVVDIIVVVMVVDDGGLFGIICNYVNVVLFGDICNVMVVLLSWLDLYKDIFQYCFQGDD